MPANVITRFLPARFPFAVALFALVAGGLGAEILPLRPSMGGENAGIGIDRSGYDPVYPPGMLYEAIYSGEARIAISVDAEGKLSDYLVIAYTQEEFAKVAVAALKRWRYHPALVRGEARASRAEIVFEFKDKGVIVQSLPGALERRMILGGLGDRYVYAPCLVGELDETPLLLEPVKPAIKGDGKPHTIIVEFYIDEEGRARMPAVERQSMDDHYAAAAVMAVEQWRFSPPLRKGRPVLVRAQQKFSFDAKP